ncbi:hypothetical protein AVEN_218556-1 [Araneus ventricosus]|uniref:Uncharacterized protein n=1 Tax=Araneus ventricosus TaxID=182803 RepID=A0A4Y2VS19_ARAVE|nr:hypothetical protein AVEN_248754-1 [Araneus ventricosus]GBO27219.1 hypothetical protein AVEN_250070-1 [Araneus ventricosus]GBO27226.1 hypothetical protein AVEN_226102-1 [Araneus ventricosus]GBO27234.1 hypothetical protein AVEN_218556-1 [Araneus ventricosus]
MESRTILESPMFGAFKLLYLMVFIFFVVVSYSTCSSPQPDQVQESARPQKVTNQRRTFKEVSLLQLRTITPPSPIMLPHRGGGDGPGWNGRCTSGVFLLAGSPKA